MCPTGQKMHFIKKKKKQPKKKPLKLFYKSLKKLSAEYCDNNAETNILQKKVQNGMYLSLQ